VACFAAAALTGCVYLSKNNDFYMGQGTTNEVMLSYFGPTCNQDVDRDGTVSSGDRALCAFFIIRGMCNGSGDNALKFVCTAVTDPRVVRNGYDANVASFILSANVWSRGGQACLRANVNTGWRAVPLGGDCQK
jgi:hypothetical protein